MAIFSRDIVSELERLTRNAALRREDLLLTGLDRTRMKKALTILSGVLALFSAGAIATVLADVFGASGTQTVAAITAAISGVISLVMGTYYNDDDIVNRAHSHFSG